MRILVGKTFGIGNAVLSIPMIKALSTLGDVDVLVGSTGDDAGAINVLAKLKGTFVKEILVNQALRDVYDVAIMAIPFDGRWHNGVHFNANTVIDGRKRPGNVERLGFDMWEKHEVEYQMDNARELGYRGPTPDTSFAQCNHVDDDLVYVGVGYKRDSGGFGQSKHFGNDRYAELLTEIRRIRPQTRFISTGTILDLVQTGKVLQNKVESFRLDPINLQESFVILSGCKAYIGNDTGFMHVAASFGMPTCGLFAYKKLTIKNPPFCARSKCIVFTPECPPIADIANDFVDFVWG